MTDEQRVLLEGWLEAKEKNLAWLEKQDPNHGINDGRVHVLRFEIETLRSLLVTDNALRERVRVLEEALRPFAEMPTNSPTVDAIPDSAIYMRSVTFTYGDIRKARDALKKE